MSEFRCEATRILGELKKNSTFLTIHGYKNNFGEVADFSIVFNVNYINALLNSKQLLQNHKVYKKHTYGKSFDINQLQAAKAEILASIEASLKGKNPAATSAAAYSRVENEYGSLVPGIKLHDREDILHLFGMKVHKRVIIPGIYPKDNRLPTTVAKDELRELLPIGKFVQFKLFPGRFTKLVICNLSINDNQVIRENLNTLKKVL